MVITGNGGTTWDNMPALDSLMTGGGVFRYQNRTGPTRFTGFNGYPQPTLASFDPADGDILVAGGADSGVFLSADDGEQGGVVVRVKQPRALVQGPVIIIPVKPHGGLPAVGKVPS